MDIPVMPHPGTDTQASPYQSRQTKEPVPIVRRLSLLAQRVPWADARETLRSKEHVNEFAFPLAKSFFDILRQTDIFPPNFGGLGNNVYLCSRKV